jgi:hypothetical protein
MKVIKNCFGGTDEMMTMEEFYTLYGRDVAEDLDRIYNNNQYSKDWTKAAIREGYHQTVIDDFLILQSL